MSVSSRFKLPQIPLPLFTVNPSQTGGRNALAGFEFQNQYIAYVLAGYFAGEEQFLAARIEGVEDLDAIVRLGDVWVERYYQVKSKAEGGGNWTITALENEGVWIPEILGAEVRNDQAN
jgi:hypothetical protein